MSKRNLTEIIKESANKYGLQYDEDSTELTVENGDGTVRIVTKEDFERAFK